MHKISMSEYLARRERALDYLAWWDRVGYPVICPVIGVLPQNRVWFAVKFAKYANGSPPPRDKNPLPLP